VEVIRDLIRDLVGILFPGGLLVFFTVLAVWAVVLPFSPSTLPSITPTDGRFIILLIVSYIAGQSLRMKRLTDLEARCTEEYRKEKHPGKEPSDWGKFKEKIDNEEKDYFLGGSDIERLKEVYRQYNDGYSFYEKFPYGYRLFARRLFHQPEHYMKFFEKYDRQGITKTETFFNFCKSVIYEYSPSFKEEVLRQESLVRLFAGLYYVIKYGKLVAVIVLAAHSILIAEHYFKLGFPRYTGVGTSLTIILVTILVLFVLLYMNREILRRLRYMRVKELNLAHDGFYLVCKKHNLDL
jgi:hypothetical protein